MSETLDQGYWNNRWQHHQLGWDIGYPSTPLVDYINGLENKGISILIPGCGNAYEAAYLLEQGFNNITVIDIAEKAVELVKEKFAGKEGIRIIHGDFFELEGRYDLILEQTFFCALDPALRPTYVSKMAELLKVAGQLVGVLFNTQFQRQGPPFGGSEAEYRPLFEKSMDICVMEPCRNSIPERQGNELFIILKKKNGKD
ncbi:methyltransferase domain-containing protein [Sphingobacterium sp. 1.A.4]|uniref:methyltransferase domain-containing protein n=1 Tax=Sphingobacterium sp. 1.A.4 TaxID=2044603 RepID=UPI000C0BE39B|nr:methyltransferase domain-containing protein [Sphingobacterium sp. 1.A.4]